MIENERTAEFELFKKLVKASLLGEMAPLEQAIQKKNLSNLNHFDRELKMIDKLGSEISKICHSYQDMQIPLSVLFALHDLRALKDEKKRRRDILKKAGLKNDKGGPRSYPLMSSVITLFMIVRFDSVDYEDDLFEFLNSGGELDIFLKAATKKRGMITSFSRRVASNKYDKNWRSVYKQSLIRSIEYHLKVSNSESQKRELRGSLSRAMKHYRADQWRSMFRSLMNVWKAFSIFDEVNLETDLQWVEKNTKALNRKNKRSAAR